jgi:hypothetical protein
MSSGADRHAMLANSAASLIDWSRAIVDNACVRVKEGDL